VSIDSADSGVTGVPCHFGVITVTGLLEVDFVTRWKESESLVTVWLGQK